MSDETETSMDAASEIEDAIELPAGAPAQEAHDTPFEKVSYPGDGPTIGAGGTGGADEPSWAAAAMGAGADGRNISALNNVPVNIQVVLGQTTLPIGQVLKIGRGAVVELNRKVGEAVDIQINHRLVARGEVVIVDDGALGVTLTEIVAGDAMSA
ncbi:MAG: flagellar motor switch protein FliN [Pseudomonadota bacterium]